jgi:Uma2 family endonuclease
LALSNDSEPKPDIAVVPGSPCDYQQHPQAALLVVEVSDKTRQYDLSLKAKLYAAARGIPEYWVVDLLARQLVVIRDPQDGGY